MFASKKMMAVDHVLDHVAEHVLDYMIISLITIALHTSNSVYIKDALQVQEINKVVGEKEVHLHNVWFKTMEFRLSNL